MTDFGLIGHPVKHSMSKVMHEAAFKELGLDYTYGLFDVNVGELKLFMDNAVFKGLNVTVPLKVEAAKYMDELSDDATLVGAVNTVEFRKGRIGHNTDVTGFMESMREAYIDVDEGTFLVIGSGGAGRSIVFRLAKEKARVYIFDKDYDKASKLAQDVLQKTGVMVEPVYGVVDAIRDVDVLVNATPVGMHPNVDESPIQSNLLNPMLTVVDIVYNPVETKLIMEAKKAGCRTVDGVGMLVHQGAQALRIWLDVEPPIEVMRQAVLDELNKGGN
ncbi:MAG: shikimate dehydrogenase [Candidatus Altiarchaeota archaeon]